MVINGANEVGWIEMLIGLWLAHRIVSSASLIDELGSDVRAFKQLEPLPFGESHTCQYLVLGQPARGPECQSELQRFPITFTTAHASA